MLTLGKVLFSGVGGVTASFVSMLCCTGPLIMASIGVSGAGLSVLRPYRPLFLVIAGVSLYWAYRMMDREEKRACEAGDVCADPLVRRRMKYTIWVMTGVAFVFASSPRWAEWVFG